jgi:dolichyl-diphosphooligosaccharide---protein glycosyltransferase
MTATVLSIVFTLTILIRSYAAKYGFYLNEFDPYYDYFAAQHIVTLAQAHGLYYALFNNPSGCGPTVYTACHSLQGYFNWHDITTWFPEGRDVAATSQGGLQLSGALIYLLVHNVFGVQITLYDLLVLLPVFFGALTSIVFYFLVRRIAGDAAGMFAAIIFAVSPPLIERGNLGWFKSEPLAILLFVTASYLMLTVFDKERTMGNRVVRGLSAGLIAGYANTAWGGGDYFTAAFGLLFLLIPFLNLDLASFSPAIISFTASTIFVSAIFPRPGVAIVTNPVGLALLGGTVFVLVGQWAKTWTKPSDYRKTLGKFLFGFAIAGLTLISFGLVGGLSLRYLSAIAPWARSGNPLVQSVAEHFVPTGADYFTSYAILLSFGMGGAIIAFKRRSVPMIYALIFGLTGLYFSSAFSRLLVYSSISLGILGGIGFAELAFAIVKPSSTSLVKKKPVAVTRNEMKVVFTLAMVVLMVLPAGTYWIPNPIRCTYTGQLFCDQSPADSGVSLTNGALPPYSRAILTDWVQTLQWVHQDTPTNAIIISWWDYGYWFAVMGNRTTTADNATLNSTRIAEIGNMFMSNASQAAKIAKSMVGDRPAYVAIFLSGSIVPIQSQSGTTQDYYILQIPSGGGFTAGGGDESKKQWFIRIGNTPAHPQNESTFLECSGTATPSVTSSGQPCQSIDDFNLTPYALQNTLFAQLFPFSFAGYLVSQSSSAGNSVALSPTYQFGTNGVPPAEAFSYPSSFQFPANSPGPFRLAYESPSLAAADSGNSPCPGNSNLQCFNVVLLYQLV